MKLQLKEQPWEWVKFTAVIAFMAAMTTLVLLHRQIVGRDVAWAIWALLTASVVICVVMPKWFRGFYRGGMTASFHIGQIMGYLILTIFFVFLLTPLALILRLLGKDLLSMKRRPVASYWRKAKPPGPLDRQF